MVEIFIFFLFYEENTKPSAWKSKVKISKLWICWSWNLIPWLNEMQLLSALSYNSCHSSWSFELSHLPASLLFSDLWLFLDRNGQVTAWSYSRTYRIDRSVDGSLRKEDHHRHLVQALLETEDQIGFWLIKGSIVYISRFVI